MSRLLIITRPALAAGFQLAGVDAYAAHDAAEAQQRIARWLENETSGLLAVDEALLRGFDREFVRRMNAAANLPYLALPGGEPLPPEETARRQIAEMIRSTVGFHITFQG
jgi:vacuolar-type H+-ATPase subunit F/Vma7